MGSRRADQSVQYPDRFLERLSAIQDGTRPECQATEHANSVISTFRLDGERQSVQARPVHPRTKGTYSVPALRNTLVAIRVDPPSFTAETHAYARPAKFPITLLRLSCSSGNRTSSARLPRNQQPRLAVAANVATEFSPDRRRNSCGVEIRCSSFQRGRNRACLLLRYRD
jgi:hypothetical protein